MYASNPHSRKAEYYFKSHENTYDCNGGTFEGNGTWMLCDGDEEEPILGPPPLPPVEFEEATSPCDGTQHQAYATLNPLYSDFPLTAVGSNPNEPPENLLLVTDCNDPGTHRSFKIIQRLGKG
jgi:hypothetical protein